MPERCKTLFMYSMQGLSGEKLKDAIKENDYTEEEINFITTKRELSDFSIGLKIPGKLLPRRIEGGVLLTPTTYEMR